MGFGRLPLALSCSEYLLEYLAASLRMFLLFPQLQVYPPEEPKQSLCSAGRDHSIVAAEVPWASLTVSVSLGARSAF